ncbi:hypothetical protein B5P44_00945 [Mycobacterium sp. CBMA 213]|uniref:hypothetical protein n=1 Tax=unclassified Mycolicibacterium TaxID=2636767 RepID=UPI0012DDAC09|nr:MULTISPECIES: hypothetical protein [unclassified Mycolicibacterium]MUL61149.1 hypothetical protein [Mycolicibacterium sp. CBMA 335]MUM03387.1 hypothetical protein [Mycolicibacterium sp. CBMA 213]
MHNLTLIERGLFEFVNGPLEAGENVAFYSIADIELHCRTSPLLLTDEFAQLLDFVSQLSVQRVSAAPLAGVPSAHNDVDVLGPLARLKRALNNLSNVGVFYHEIASRSSVMQAWWVRAGHLNSPI